MYHHQEEDHITINITILSPRLDGVRDTALRLPRHVLALLHARSPTRTRTATRRLGYDATLHVQFANSNAPTIELLDVVVGEKHALLGG